MKTPDLKRCPFCGFKPFVYEMEPHEHKIVRLPKYDGAYVVECPLCEVGFVGKTMEEVTCKWNRRVTYEKF